MDELFIFTQEIMSLQECHPEDVFKRESFMGYQPPTKQELTAAEKKWLSLKTVNPEATAPPPTKFAERFLDNQLAEYSFQMPVTREAWQNFVMFKYYELANDVDPKISKPALDALAKTSIVGLNEERVEVNINTRSTVEIEAEVLTLVQKLVERKPTEEIVVDAEFEE